MRWQKSIPINNDVYVRRFLKIPNNDDLVIIYTTSVVYDTLVTHHIRGIQLEDGDILYHIEKRNKDMSLGISFNQDGKSFFILSDNIQEFDTRNGVLIESYDIIDDNKT